MKHKATVKQLVGENKKLRWRHPQINLTPTGEERKVYWLDLFFDLVFVVAIGQLAHLFHGGITRKIIIEFVILFVPVRWLWINATYYTARFEELTIRHRLYMFALMIPVIGMGYAVHGAVGDLAPWYIGSYVLAKLLLARLRYVGGKSQQQSKDLPDTTRAIARANIVTSIVWIGSLFVPPPFRYVLWFGTMFGELIRAYGYRSTSEDDVPNFHMGHLTERFGLFTIIVLAEIIIGVFAGVSEVDYMTLDIVITSIAAFLIACLLWWIYFDFIMSRPLHKEENGNSKLFLWTYGHLPLTLCITILGGSLSHIIHLSGDHINPIPLWTIVGSICFVLLTIAYLSHFHQATDLHDTIRFGDDKMINVLFAKKIIKVIVLLIGRTGIYQILGLAIYWFVLGIVFCLSILAIDGIMLWVHAIQTKNK